MTDALDIGVGIFIIGLIIGLPQIDTFLVNFTEMSSIAINMMRLGLTAMFVWVIIDGR